MTHGYKITICSGRAYYSVPTREWIRNHFGITNEEILNFIRTKKTLPIVGYQQEPNSPKGVEAFEGECYIEKIRKPTKKERREAVKIRRRTASMMKRLMKNISIDVAELADFITT